MKLDSSLLIPSKKWTAVQWVDEYDNLKSYFGDPKRAKTAWLAAWNKRASSDANTSDLRHEMKKRGIDIPADGIIGSILDEKNSIIDSVASFAKIGGSVAIIFYIIIFIIALVVVAKLIKMLNPEAVGTIVKYAK